MNRMARQREAIRRRDSGDATREIARSYNVSHSTISRFTKLTSKKEPPQVGGSPGQRSEG
jgi:transposase